MPELRTLRQFVAVAEELHFSRAAQRLHMTQPPLSLAIRGLERELGAELFQRTQRSVSLSAAGAALLPQVRHLLAEAARPCVCRGPTSSRSPSRCGRSSTARLNARNASVTAAPAPWRVRSKAG